MPDQKTLRLIVPTFYGDVENRNKSGLPEFGAPFVPVTIKEEDGIRVVLGDHKDAASVWIERRPNGWAMGFMPDQHGDDTGYVYLMDAGDSYVLPETINGVKVLGRNENEEEVLVELTAINPLHWAAIAAATPIPVDDGTIEVVVRSDLNDDEPITDIRLLAYGFKERNPGTFDLGDVSLYFKGDHWTMTLRGFTARMSKQPRVWGDIRKICEALDPGEGPKNDD